MTEHSDLQKPPETSEARVRVTLARATAEFFAIVVGVLVALAVNGWAARRGDRASEIAYLDALILDLRADSASFEGSISYLERGAAALDDVRRIALLNAPFPQDSVRFLTRVGLSSAYVLGIGDNRATFNELLTTGNLGLIESRAVRSSIVQYYAELDRHLARSADRASGYVQLVRSYLPVSLTQLNDSTQMEAGTRSLGVARASRILHDADISAAVNRHYVLQTYQISALRQSKREVGALLQQLEAEVARLR